MICGIGGIIQAIAAGRQQAAAAQRAQELADGRRREIQIQSRITRYHMIHRKLPFGVVVWYDAPPHQYVIYRQEGRELKPVGRVNRRLPI